MGNAMVWDGMDGLAERHMGGLLVAPVRFRADRRLIKHGDPQMMMRVVECSSAYCYIDGEPEVVE